MPVVAVLPGVATIDRQMTSMADQAWCQMPDRFPEESPRPSQLAGRSHTARETSRPT